MRSPAARYMPLRYRVSLSTQLELEEEPPSSQQAGIKKAKEEIYTRVATLRFPQQYVSLSSACIGRRGLNASSVSEQGPPLLALGLGPAFGVPGVGAAATLCLRIARYYRAVLAIIL